MYCALISYYPQWLVLSFSLLVFLTGYRFPRVAAVLIISAFSISLAYNSLILSIIYLAGAFLFMAVTIRTEFFPQMFLLIAGCPFLAMISFSGYNVPIEFSVVFLAPILIKRSKPLIPLTAVLACFWLSIIGIIGQFEIMGNLIIGEPKFVFLNFKEPVAVFSDFTWIAAKISDFRLKGWETLSLSVFKLIEVFLTYPLIFVQAFVWAAISHVMGIFINKNKLNFDFTAIFSGIIMLILLKGGVEFIYHKSITAQFFKFIFTVIPVAALILAGWKLSEFIGEKLGLLITQKQIANARKIQSQPSNIIKNVIKKEFASSVSAELDLSAEALKQEELAPTKYMKRKFVYDATVLYIDVVESTNLKQGESHEKIITSFTQYWRIVDDTFWNRQGRLLNRSGDGAAYVFKYADYAVLSVKELFKRLSRFNKKENVLKMSFRVRIGLNSGKIVEDAARSDGEVFSSTIDIAAHLEKVAEPDQMVISAQTYQNLQKTKNLFEYKGHSDKDQVEIYVLKDKAF